MRVWKNINRGTEMRNLICSECKKEGKSSYVHVGLTTQTAMMPLSYFDRKGVYHHHDSNITTTEYFCSEGHSWREESRSNCWCGWKGEKEVEAK